MTFSEFKEKYQTEEVTEVPNSSPHNPVVSVLVQTYQHRDFISQCLDSILIQKADFPFEVLLGEDASTDGTREICREYAEKFPDRIRLFLHHPANKIKILDITTGNFNALYNYYSAKGKFIAFCEGDDLWTDPLKLQKQVDALKQNPNLAFTYHAYKEVNEKEELISKQLTLNQPAQDIAAEDLKKLKYHPLLSTMCFRNFGNVIPRELTEIINVDSFLISFLGKFGAAEFRKNVKPNFYRIHPGGIWSKKTKRRKYESKILTYEKLKDFYSREEEWRLASFYESLYLNYKKMQIRKSFLEKDFTEFFCFFKDFILKNIKKRVR